MKALIITSTLCLAFFQMSVWWAWGTWRRPADDLVKIIQAQSANQIIDTPSRAEECIRANGIPRYWQGEFENCDKKDY